MYLPDAGDEVHVKGAYLAGASVFAVKTATGFTATPGWGFGQRGRPAGGGLGVRRADCRGIGGGWSAVPPAMS